MWAVPFLLEKRFCPVPKSPLELKNINPSGSCLLFTVPLFKVLCNISVFLKNRRTLSGARFQLFVSLIMIFSRTPVNNIFCALISGPVLTGRCSASRISLELYHCSKHQIKLILGLKLHSWLFLWSIYIFLQWTAWTRPVRITALVFTVGVTVFRNGPDPDVNPRRLFVPNTALVEGFLRTRRVNANPAGPAQTAPQVRVYTF